MSESTILEHRVKLTENRLDKVESRFEAHEQNHQRVENDMKNHGERIVAMESIMPDLRTTLGEVVKTTQALNATMIRIDEQTQVNTAFRQKFTWKEITALAVAILAIMSGITQIMGVM